MLNRDWLPIVFQTRVKNASVLAARVPYFLHDILDSFSYDKNLCRHMDGADGHFRSCVPFYRHLSATGLRSLSVTRVHNDAVDYLC